MKRITISGEIGWDVWPDQVRAEFDRAGGEDVMLEISSPGGYVYDGIEIFNIIKNYQGNVTAKIVGLAASMASYIPLAANKVIAEPNAVFMIHNASACVCGDHNDMRRAADVTEGFTGLIAKEYEKKTERPENQIRSEMDAETWYFGEEIKAAGFADEMTDGEIEPQAKGQLLLTAKAKVKAVVDKVKKSNREDEITKIAAILPIKNQTVPSNQKVEPPSDNSQNPSKGEKMNLEECKAKYPELYAQVLEEGRKAEAKRVSGHAIMAEKTKAYEYALECIKDPSRRVTDDDVFASYQTAAMKIQNVQDRKDDNPEVPVTDETDKSEDEQVGNLVDQVMARNKTKKQGRA